MSICLRGLSLQDRKTPNKLGGPHYGRLALRRNHTALHYTAKRTNIRAHRKRHLILRRHLTCASAKGAISRNQRAKERFKHQQRVAITGKSLAGVSHFVQSGHRAGAVQPHGQLGDGRPILQVDKPDRILRIVLQDRHITVMEAMELSARSSTSRVRRVVSRFKSSFLAI